MSNLCC